MRILIAEDDPVGARALEGLLSRYGECVLVEDGDKALSSYVQAQKDGSPFELICLDILMPHKGGQEVLAEIRRFEQENGAKPSQEAKVVMTTALDDVRSVMGAYKGGATAYITKPISAERLHETIRSLGIVA